MANFKLILCMTVYLSCNLISITSSTEAPTVKTPQGVLKGKYLQSRDGRQYEAYLGVRYGVVSERFEVSVPSPSWEGTKDATEFGEQCPQPTLTGGIIGDEDCLFLNVYTPKADNKRRPVLIFIHGGGFTYGAGDGYGGKYFMDEEIVLVTVNYRLGVLGFLDSRDGLVTGNMGLKDLVVALKWVKENIDDFGGDASRVTVSGESAGGAAALHLMISPLAKGLFHHVLAQSGSPRNPWAYTENTLQHAVTLAKKLECSTESSTEFVKCLKQKPLQEILAVQGTAFARFHVDPMFPFTPTMETKNNRNPEPFLKDTPADILRGGQFTRLPVLMTVNREEGALLHAGSMVTNDALVKKLNDEFYSAAPITFLYETNPGLQTHRKEVTKKMRKFYFGEDDINADKFENLTNLYTDSWFLHGIHESALSLAEHTTVYTGLVTHRRKDWSMLSLFGVAKNFDVTAHCDELSYLYNQASEGKAMTLISKQEVVDKDDVEFSRAFIKTIVSFASSGIPKIHVGKPSKWTPVGKKERETGHLNFVNLGLEDFVHVKPFEKRMKFWQKLYKWDKDWNKDEL